MLTKGAVDAASGWRRGNESAQRSHGEPTAEAPIWREFFKDSTLGFNITDDLFISYFTLQLCP